MVTKNDEITSISNSSILGTYEGECADANITNLNGLDITRPVWENVFSSEDYKKAIKLGWYIGFLGHPEDPNCMDFRNACIVMTDGWIDNNGKVHGKFNLIDTPVGRVVYAFQQAGVVFGISVRGAGDIVDNSVDPDTFVFRGFDLVAFPAYPDSIPKFTQIAASTDIDARKKYQKVCAAVDSNLKDIQDVNALDVIQSQFAAQSDEYAAIENQKKAIKSSSNLPEDKLSIIAEKLEAMTKLYIEASSRIKQLAEENERVKIAASQKVSRCTRKLDAVRRITASQTEDMQNRIASLESKYKTSVAANKQLKKEISILQNSNLKYKVKIESADEIIRSKDSVISSMRIKLNETVNDAKDSDTRASNLDEKIKDLERKVLAAEKLQAEYQRAYADLYANAVGIDSSKVRIDAGMSIKDIQSAICSSTQIQDNPMMPEPVDLEDSIDDYEDSLVTL